jgi:PEGA domain
MRKWRRHMYGIWAYGCLAIIGLGIILMLLTGCTTILSSNPQPVTVNSSPPQATVLVNGSPMGQTPTTVNLDRKMTYTIETQKPGASPYAQMLTKTVDPMFFLNILFLPGFLVDLATGTWQKFPDQVMAPMVPVTTSRR